MSNSSSPQVAVATLEPHGLSRDQHFLTGVIPTASSAVSRTRRRLKSETCGQHVIKRAARLFSRLLGDLSRGTDDDADSAVDGVDSQEQDTEYEDHGGDDAREQGAQHDDDPEDDETAEDAREDPVNAPVLAEPPATEPATNTPSNPASTYPSPSGSSISPTAVASPRTAMTIPTLNPTKTALQCTALTSNFVVHGNVRPQFC